MTQNYSTPEARALLLQMKENLLLNKNSEIGVKLSEEDSLQMVLELEKLQAEMEDRNTLIESLINSTNDAIYIKDLKGRYLYFNEAAARITGKKKEDVIGQDDYFLFSGEEAEEVIKGEKKVMKEGKVKTYEETVTGADNKLNTYLSTKGPISDKTGKIIGLFGIARDITELKKSRDELIESETKFRTGFDQSPVGGVIVDLDFSFVRCNSSFCNFLNYREEDLIGKKFADITYSEDKEKGLNDIKQIIEGKKKSARFVKRYISKEGKILWGIVNIGIVKDKNDKPLYFLTTVEDITERKKAEEELIVSEEKYRLLHDNAGIGVGVYDTEGKILLFNKQALKNMGGKAEDYIGKNLKDAFGEEKGTKYINRIKEVVKSETSIEYEDHIITSAGDFWFNSIQTRIKDKDGGIIGVQVIAKDITNRKKTEKELHKKIEELQRFHDLTVGRELKMIELKKEVNELAKKAGMEERYKIVK